MTPESPRKAAALAIMRILGNGAYSNIAVNSVLSSVGDNVSDRSLCTRIIMTAVERAKTLDYIVGLLCKKKPEAILRALIFTGAVQILYMDRIPDSAACDETVKAAKELTDSNRAGFVNAVLRNICRSKDKIKIELEEAPDEIKYSLDPTIIGLLREQYPVQADTVLENFFKEPPLFITPNLLKSTAENIAAMLSDAGCEIGYKDGYMYVSGGAAKAISMLDSGMFFIQGYASRYAVDLLGAKPGERIIDVCACPGGKTLGAAISMNNRGEIFAFDIHKNKLSLIEKSASKLGAGIIRVAEHDGREALGELNGTADRVICDVPCSALGVIATRPEIRYKNISELSSLRATQYAILCASAEYLKPGGTLVYSTCTFNREENIEQTERFLKEHKGYVADNFCQFMPDGLTDGFFCCRIIKNG